MSRKPQDKLSQRGMVVPLRTTIDAALVDGRSWRSVERLIRENPHASTSSHVRHNLGMSRVSALRARSPLFSLAYAPRTCSLQPLRCEAPDSLRATQDDKTE